KDAGDLERDEIGIGGLALGLDGLEERVVFDRVVYRGGGEEGVEPALVRRGVVLIEDGVDDGALGKRLAGLGRVLALGFEVVDVEAKDVLVLDRVSDRVDVELALEQVLGGEVGSLVAGDLSARSVLLEDRRAGEAEELGVGEKLLAGRVILLELRTMALVEDDVEPL